MGGKGVFFRTGLGKHFFFLWGRDRSLRCWAPLSELKMMIFKNVGVKLHDLQRSGNEVEVVQ